MRTSRTRAMAFAVAGFFAVALLLAFLPRAEAAEGTCYVVASALNLRSTPATSGRKLTVLPRGALLTVLNSSVPGWYQVQYGSLTGYVSAAYVSFSGGASYGSTISMASNQSSIFAQGGNVSVAQNVTIITPVANTQAVAQNNTQSIAQHYAPQALRLTDNSPTSATLPKGLTAEYLKSLGYKPGESVTVYYAGQLQTVVVPEEITAAPVSYVSAYAQFGDRGATVITVQTALRQLGFFNDQVTGYFGSITRDAVLRFQIAQNFPSTGIVDQATFQLMTAMAGPLSVPVAAPQIPSPAPVYPSDVTNQWLSAGYGQTGTAQMIAWDDVDKVFATNSVATVVDVQTGLAFNVKRWAGHMHADVEPVSVADTQTMYAIYGGKIDATRRPVHVKIGNLVIAGSIYGVPHGTKTIPDNGFNGQFCIHFLGSRVHESNKVDSGHQAAIQAAALAPVR